MRPHIHSCVFFFFNDTATPEIYTLSLHDALPSSSTIESSTPASSSAAPGSATNTGSPGQRSGSRHSRHSPVSTSARSEEHTSELQSRQYLVCRLLLEKKK